MWVYLSTTVRHQPVHVKLSTHPIPTHLCAKHTRTYVQERVIFHWVIGGEAHCPWDSIIHNLLPSDIGLLVEMGWDKEWCAQRREEGVAASLERRGNGSYWFCPTGLPHHFMFKTTLILITQAATNALIKKREKTQWNTMRREWGEEKEDGRRGGVKESIREDESGEGGKERGGKGKK